MGKLVYMTNMSLDGYTEDASGSFHFADPNNDEEMHHWLFEHVMQFRTSLYGRRMYDTMVYWETAHEEPGQEPHDIEFARAWQAAEKIVYSRTMTEVRSGNTRIEREFDAEAIRALKAGVDHTIGIGGPELAAEALRAGLVDEVHFRICPVVVGGGKRFLPEGLRLDLELLEERRFKNGDVFLRYAVRA